LDNIPYWGENITMKSLKRDFKLGSLEMLARREMEKSDFSFAKECSNDRVPSQYSTSLFIEEMGVHRMP